MTNNKVAQQRRREERARVAMGQRQRNRRNTNVWFAVAAVVVVVCGIGAMVAVRVASNPSASQGSPRSSVSPAVLRAVSAVPATSFDQVGLGGGDPPLPTPVQGPALTIDGKPGVVYVGAEYCPYCAAERWATVVALSRFGTFKNLGATHSAAADVYPNTATFSFHGATYTSRYLTFQGVETQSNTPLGNTYAPLDTLTPLQKDLLARYDGPPYFSSAGAIPFIDFGNLYAVSGAGYLPSVLAGMTMSDIAGQLHDPTTPVAQAILGTANVLTAAVCATTNQQPGDVCHSSAVAAASSKLPHG